jgi:predicted exporter
MVTFMRTTIDVPDELLHRAKIVAARRKTTLKELVVQGLDYATRVTPSDVEAERKERARQLIGALAKGRNEDPIGRLDRDEIYDRHQGKWE